MPTTIGSSTSYQLSVPSLSDTADIQVALKLLAYGQSSDPTDDADIESNSLAGYIKLLAPINNPIFTGLVTLPTGTSSVAPLKFVSGTNLTTPVAGSLEYDGKVFYGTPKVNNTTAGRGLVPTEQILINSSNITKTNTKSGSGTQTQQYSAFDKGIYLAANTTYFVEISLRMATTVKSATNSPSSSSVSASIKTPTGASIALDAEFIIGLINLTDAAGSSSAYVSSSTSTTIAAGTRGSVTTRYSILKWSGVIAVSSTAGNMYPNIILSAQGSDTGGPDGGPADSSAAFTLYANSYIKVTPIGTSGTEINIGGWA
jgi:hypothetical protein